MHLDDMCLQLHVQVLRGSGKERALLRVYASPTSISGIQIATKTIDEGVRCVKYIADMHAQSGDQLQQQQQQHNNNNNLNRVDFVDLNCGCPIDEVAKRRGLGSALLRKPEKLERLLRGIVDGVEALEKETGMTMPAITAKVRTSPSGDDKINIDEIARAVENAGYVHALQSSAHAGEWKWRLG